MVMPAWYDKLVEAKMHKVTQLSEAETAKEIAEVTEGVFAEREEGNKWPEIKMNLVNHIEQTPEVVGYVTKSGRVYKSKPGRKPKESK